MSADRWIKQTKLHDPEKGVIGNCAQAAIASILNISLDEVPDFNELSGNKPVDCWGLIEEFLEKRGFYVLYGAASEGLHLASGPSHRGELHLVVMKDGKLIHDPHPDNTGLSSIAWTYTLIPLDPAQVQTTRLISAAAYTYND